MPYNNYPQRQKSSDFLPPELRNPGAWKALANPQNPWPEDLSTDEVLQACSKILCYNILTSGSNPGRVNLDQEI